MRGEDLESSMLARVVDNVRSRWFGIAKVVVVELSSEFDKEKLRKTIWIVLRRRLYCSSVMERNGHEKSKRSCRSDVRIVRHQYAVNASHFSRIRKKNKKSNFVPSFRRKESVPAREMGQRKSINQ
jgi:hypothetical protein